MGAQHVDLSARVTKEGTDPSHHLGVGTFPHPAGLVMKLKGHDQKQMLCVDGDMRFPHVLKVVVVGCRSATLHLGNDSSPWPKWEEEVWPSTCHEAILRAQDQLSSEPKATFEKLAYGPLDCAALGTMNMKGCDEVDAAVQVLNELARESIDPLHLGSFLGGESGTHQRCVLRHGRSLAAEERRS